MIIEMIKFSDFRPPLNTEQLLLYFPKVKEYRICNNIDSCQGEYAFSVNPARSPVSDYASHWGKLK